MRVCAFSTAARAFLSSRCVCAHCCCACCSSTSTARSVFFASCNRAPARVGEQGAAPPARARARVGRRVGRPRSRRRQRGLERRSHRLAAKVHGPRSQSVMPCQSHRSSAHPVWGRRRRVSPHRLRRAEGCCLPQSCSPGRSSSPSRRSTLAECGKAPKRRSAIPGGSLMTRTLSLSGISATSG